MGLPGGLTIEAMWPLVGQHEPGVAAEQLGGAVAGLPRAQVVGDAGHDVRVGVDLAEVDRSMPSIRAAPGWVSALVIARSMKSRCSAAVIRVVSAFQYRMSNGRAAAVPEQVVVDPVVPDQVVGPQPGEDLGQRPPVEVALAPGTPSPRPRPALRRQQRARQPGLRLVEHGHRQAERRDPVAGRRVPRGARAPSRRGCRPSRARRSRPASVPVDLLAGVHRLDDRLRRSCRGPSRRAGVGVAPGDREHLLAAARPGTRPGCGRAARSMT